ncbi:MAG: hypothetical protein ACOX2O_08690 [Bdellovibrionota bacterium]|jgi:hypothetical protein
MKQIALRIILQILILIVLPACSTKTSVVPTGMQDDIFRPDKKQIAREVAKGYEAPPILHAKNILSRNLIKSSLYEVQDTVYNDGFLNHYTIKTEWGDFYAGGTQKLKVRLNEIIAIDALKKISTREAVVTSAKQSGKAIIMAPIKTVKTVGTAILNPAATAKTVISIPLGIVDFFKGASTKVSSKIDDAKEELDELDEKDTSDSNIREKIIDAGTSYAKDFTGYNKQVNEIEKHFGLDPDSDNEVLRDEIERVAGIKTSVSFSTILIPKIPMISAISQTSSIIKRVNKISVYQNKIIQAQKVHKKLLEIGIDEETIRRFQRSSKLTSSMKTKITNNVLFLDHVENRIEIIRTATSLQDYESAWVYLQIIEALPALHEQNRFVRVLSGFPTFVTASGKAIIPFPTDYLFWTETLATIINNIEKRIKKDRTITSVEVRVSGKISSRVSKELKKRGIIIRSL